MCLAFKHINIKINNTPHVYMYIYLRYELAASTWTQNYIYIGGHFIVYMYMGARFKLRSAIFNKSLQNYIVKKATNETASPTQTNNERENERRRGGGGGAYATIRRAIDERILIIIIVRDGDMVLLLMPLQFTKEEPI